MIKQKFTDSLNENDGSSAGVGYTNAENIATAGSVQVPQPSQTNAGEYGTAGSLDGGTSFLTVFKGKSDKSLKKKSKIQNMFTNLFETKAILEANEEISEDNIEDKFTPHATHQDSFINNIPNIIIEKLNDLSYEFVIFSPEKVELSKGKNQTAISKTLKNMESLKSSGIATDFYAVKGIYTYEADKVTQFERSFIVLNKKIKKNVDVRDYKNGLNLTDCTFIRSLSDSLVLIKDKSGKNIEVESIFVYTPFRKKMEAIAKELKQESILYSPVNSTKSYIYDISDPSSVYLSGILEFKRITTKVFDVKVDKEDENFRKYDGTYLDAKTFLTIK